MTTTNATNELRAPAGAGLVLFAMLLAAFALDFAIIGTTGGEPALRLDRIGAELLRAQGSTIWPLEAWLYALMVVPFLIFVPGLYWTLRAPNDSGLPALGALLLTAFWILQAIHNAAVVAVLQVLVPAYSAGAPTAASIEAAARALLGFSNTVFTPGGGVGNAMFVLGMAAIGRATLRGGRLPRWTGFAAYGASLLSLLAYLQYVAAPFFFLGLFGFVLFIAWLGGASVQLLRAPSPAALATASPATAYRPGIF